MEDILRETSRQGLGTNGGRERTSVVLGSGVKTNSIPPVAYLHRSTNSKQPLSMVHVRSSLPPSSRVLIKNISQKCSRDDRKLTLGGLHGRGMVQTSGVGPPMVPGREKKQVPGRLMLIYFLCISSIHIYIYFFIKRNKYLVVSCLSTFYLSSSGFQPSTTNSLSVFSSVSLGKLGTLTLPLLPLFPAVFS